MHYARMSRKTGSRSTSGKGKGACSYHQRCAVRVTYLNNKTRGQWQAHGRYLARESATFADDAKAVGFNRENDGIDIVRQLGGWQGAGDERLFKLQRSRRCGPAILTNPCHLGEEARELRIPAKANAFPKGSRTAFRAEAEHHRSVATLAF
jgi:hypothetical protein